MALRWILLAIAGSVLWAAAGCDVFLPALGGEGQSCFENRTCKADLMCVDGVCRPRLEPDGGDGADGAGDGADGGDLQAGDDGGAGDADAGTDAGTDGDGFIPECIAGETRCRERDLERCVEPGVWQADHRCKIGCDGAGVDCLKVVDIACGHSHTCAALSDGRVMCWGNNDEGQLGIGTFGHGTVPPARVYNMAGAPLANVRQVEASQKTSLAIHFDNTISCWGRNAKGACAISPAGGSVPGATAVTSVQAAQVVAGTWESNGAIAADGTASYWGCKLLGESCFDNPNFDASPQAIEGFDSVLSLCLGGDYACGLLSTGGSAEVRCFGRNREGQLGNASLDWENSASPVKVDGSDGWTGLGCANGAVFAWGPAGAYSWGSSAESGALGDGVSGPHYRQVPGPLLLVDVFDNPLPIRSIRGGMRHACAEVEAGGGLVSIYCWGYSLHGQVGGPAFGNNVFYLRPIMVQNLPPVRKLAVGWEHNCVVLEDGETVKCWGFNNLGCVNGTASPQDISSPADVAFP